MRHIRASDVFLFAKPDHSVGSQACPAERSNLLADIQYVEFRPDDVISGFVVLDEVDRAAERAGPLPHPLPEEPAIPFAYLGEIPRQDQKRQPRQ